MRISKLAHTFRRDDAGVALVMVLGVGSVLALLAIAAVAFALGGIRSSRTNADWNGALAAAFAGVEEYQGRLAADPGYTRYGNPASAFSAETGSAVVLPGQGRANPAFDVGTAGTWATVPGSAGGAPASFRYEVNNSEFSRTGTLALRSTGRVGAETRSVLAELRVTSFLDYLYFTDLEIEDPAQYQPAAVVPCSVYAYAGRPTGSFIADGVSTSCHPIAFGTADVLTGAVHSNDTIRACAATFAGPVTTASGPVRVGGPLYRSIDSTGASCAASVFDDPASPSRTAPVVMPATNTELLLETRTDAATGEPGCLYSGPTDIVFHGDGTVTVRSPWTKATQTRGAPASAGSTPAVCGTVGPTGLGSELGATFEVPDHTVMYVQGVPAVAGDPNYTAPGSTPRVGTGGGVTDLACTGADGQAGNGIGYPMAGEAAPSASSYGCRAGDAFVRGELDGAVTVATSHFLYVTGDSTYANDDAVLGLVGDGAVLVWNPVTAADASLLDDPSLGAPRGGGRTIHAAILSVAHTFQVQGYTRGGDRGTLTVVGAIAQKYRGIVRSGTHGYAKDYRYDQRFRYLAPPNYLMPVSTTYGVAVWIEVSAGYASTGAVR